MRLLPILALSLLTITGCKKKEEDAAKNSSDKAAVDKTAADKTAADKTAADKTAADKTAADKTAADKTAADKTAADKTAADKTAVPPEKVEPPADAFTPPFDFNIAAKAMDYKPREMLWATYPVNSTGGWGYNKVRFSKAMGDWAEISSLSKFVTHSAFLHNDTTPDPKSLKKGTPVKLHKGVGVKYGRVVKVADDKVTVNYYVSGPKTSVGEFPITSVELWNGPALDPGTSFTYKEGESTKLYRVAHVENGKVYAPGPKGLLELNEADAKPIDPTKVFKKGAKVWVYGKKGAFGTYEMKEGKITKAHDKGVWYEWESSVKNVKIIGKVNYSWVVKR